METPINQMLDTQGNLKLRLTPMLQEEAFKKTTPIKSQTLSFQEKKQLFGVTFGNNRQTEAIQPVNARKNQTEAKPTTKVFTKNETLYIRTEESKEEEKYKSNSVALKTEEKPSDYVQSEEAKDIEKDEKIDFNSDESSDSVQSPDV